MVTNLGTYCNISVEGNILSGQIQNRNWTIQIIAFSYLDRNLLVRIVSENCSCPKPSLVSQGKES